ncbi:flagellin [Xylophilus sp. GW821-FHT01B05]
MASTINTNIVSLNAQRNLSASQTSLATSMQRLSSGLRVNSAKDDAAGLAISERMNTQVKGLAVAARNANDGISLAQTAEGALGKVGDMLQRMRELAVQAGNATNSASDRKSLQAEVSQLSDEIDRVAKTTTFNGQKLLNGSFAGAVFQVGSNSGDNITIGNLGNAKASDLGSVAYGTASGAVTTTAAGSGGYGAAISGVTITVSGSTPIMLSDIPAATSSSERVGQVIAAINAKTADTGLTAFLGDDGTTVEYRSDRVDANGNALTVTVSGLSATTAGIADASITAATTGSATLGIGVDDTTGKRQLTVATQADAWVALKKIDSAIDTVNSSRADLGAIQSRFETSIDNINVQSENMSAARGRIVDADFAAETANLSRAQILQQAGTAMVAQANQLPQSVLTLLRGGG